MSKRYFVKFLPVEGKIEIGDRVIDAKIAPKDGLIFQGGDNFLNDMGDTVTLPQWQTRFNFQKLKLFLCSKDVKIGDIVYDPHNNKYYIYHLNMDSEYLFTVIGKISKDAIWVKEGDEFTKDLFNRQYTYDEFFNCIGFICRIKCPTCNTFH